MKKGGRGLYTLTASYVFEYGGAEVYPTNERYK